MGRLLKQQGYTLQRTRKTLEGAQHQDRDGQFRYLNEQARAHLAAGQPVTSVDTKKKELVGNFAGGGAEWQPVGEPVEAGVHDFSDPALGKAIPYGVYDLGANTGMASGITASSQGCIARRERNAVVLGPRSLPAVAGLCLTVVVVMVVDDAGTGRSQSAGGAVPGPRAWDHIPPCGSDDLAVSVRWERVGVGLVGQIIVENVSGRTCQLSEKPWVVPLGADGKQLPVEALSTMEARDQPVILAPGERAAAPVEWAGWCGDPASGVARVNWFSGSAVVEVEGPRQPDCPDPGQPTNLRRLGSTPWTDRPARRAAHEDVWGDSAGFLRTVCG